MAKPVRITTRPDYFDEHSENLELWSPGSPAFPEPDLDLSNSPEVLGYECVSDLLSARSRS